MQKEEKKEVWKDIPEYEGLYQVSNMGQVKSLNYLRTGKEKILKPTNNGRGYLILKLCKNGKKKNFTIHQLVAQTFLKNDNNLPCVNHKNEVKTDNRLENLEFCSYQYNNSYGTKPKRISETKKGKMLGENNPMYGKKLTEEHKQKISISHKGKHLSDEHKKKLSIASKGKPKSEETKQKMSIASKGKPKSKEHIQKISEANRKPILQFTKNMVFIRYWDSATTASKELKIHQGHISSCCNGKYKSAGGFIWKYKE